MNIRVIKLSKEKSPIRIFIIRDDRAKKERLAFYALYLELSTGKIKNIRLTIRREKRLNSGFSEPEISKGTA